MADWSSLVLLGGQLVCLVMTIRYGRQTKAAAAEAAAWAARAKAAAARAEAARKRMAARG